MPPSWDTAYFKSIPWTAALLSDPEYTILPSRFGKPTKDTRGEFFTRTLATENTITACIFQTRTPDNKSKVGGKTSQRPIVSEVRAFLDTRAGVNGFPGIAHGGFVAAVIDEVMGYLINSNRASTETGESPPDTTRSPTESQQQQAVPMTTPGSAVMTAELTFKYRRPVPTGETVMVRTWIEKLDGRKIFVKATVEAEEREILTEGYGVFVALRQKGKMPEVRKRGMKI